MAHAQDNGVSRGSGTDRTLSAGDERHIFERLCAAFEEHLAFVSLLAEIRNDAGDDQVIQLGLTRCLERYLGLQPRLALLVAEAHSRSTR